MINSSAIVIAGGKNKRINMVKPLINLGGKQILIRINDILSKLFSETILVIRKDQSDDIADLGMVLGMHIVEDKYENLGPIAGIYTGLLESISEKNFIIGGDYPFLSEKLIKKMIDISNDSKSVFIKKENVINPLHAIYEKSSWINILLNNLENGNFSTKSIIEQNYKQLRSKLFPIDHLDNEYNESLLDIDTLEDLKKAKQIIYSKNQTIRPDIRPEGI